MMKYRFVWLLVGFQFLTFLNCYSQVAGTLKKKFTDKFHIKDLILEDSVSLVREIRDFSILEILGSDSIGIFMFLENTPHSHRYILLYEKGVAQILWDKKYRSAKILMEEVNNFIARNDIKNPERRKTKKTFRQISRNLRKLYGKDGNKNYYRI